MAESPEVIAFPDAEAFAVKFLKSQYRSRGVTAGAGTKITDSVTSGFTRVSRAGGGVRDIVTDSPLLLIECFAADTVTASELARVTRALMLASARLSAKVTRAVDGDGVSFLPDPTTNNPRYQFVVQLDLRGSAI